MTRRRKAYPKVPRQWRKYVASLFSDGYSVINRGPRGFSIDHRGSTIAMEPSPIDRVLKEAVSMGLGDVGVAPAGAKAAFEKQGERDMRRKRTTSRGRSVEAEIERLEAILAADEKQIEDWGDELAEEESKVVQEGMEKPVPAEVEDQNEQAMENWPVEAREKVARRLLRMANALLAE